MKYLYIVCFAIISLTQLTAQPFYKTYDWDNNPSYDTSDLANESLVSLKEQNVSEFYFTENDEFVEYVLEHNVFLLNTDDKIEYFNKVYIPYSSESNSLINKARVINPNGKIINLDQSKILTAVDEETNRTVKYFAFEGIEKGSIIEYLYVIKKYPSYSGKRVTFQSDYIRKNVQFQLIAPTNLIFKFKSYNGLPEVVRDENATNKNKWILSSEQIDKLEEEELSAYNAEKKYLIYALYENTASKVKDITSYSNVTKNIDRFYNESLEKKTMKALEDLLVTIGIFKDNIGEEQIRILERYIKSNIYLADVDNDNLSNLDNVLKDKVADDTGMTKLFIQALNYLDIKYQMVLTCRRDDMKFDKTFESNNFLQEFLIYFPDYNTYLSPTDSDSRYGYPPAYLTDNYGLFIKKVKIGDYNSALGKIEYIEPVKADDTYDKMIIDVNFNNPEDFTQTEIRMDKAMFGYYAMYLHPFMDLIKTEDREEIVEGYAKNINENITLTSQSIENGSSSLFGSEPLKFIMKFTSDAFVNKAGRKYLFKVGELIGPQIEMYQEKARQLPVENEYQRSYYRTITVTLPEGFEITNLEDINIDNSFVKDGKELLSFKSYYSLEGNILTITADEHYRVNYIPLETYEDYRKVINSAADFNKITLVMQLK